MTTYQRSFVRVCWSCLLAFSLCLAQSNDATLTISVVDPNGAAIRDARVQLNTNDIKSKSANTNRSGEARLQRLAIGSYRVIVEAAGFEAQIVDTVTLQAGANTLQVKLNIANVKDGV